MEIEDEYLLVYVRMTREHTILLGDGETLK